MIKEKLITLKLMNLDSYSFRESILKVDIVFLGGKCLNIYKRT
jgi:hypothetical protein